MTSKRPVQGTSSFEGPQNPPGEEKGARGKKEPHRDLEGFFAGTGRPTKGDCLNEKKGREGGHFEREWPAKTKKKTSTKEFTMPGWVKKTFQKKKKKPRSGR